MFKNVRIKDIRNEFYLVFSCGRESWPQPHGRIRSGRYGVHKNLLPVAGIETRFLGWPVRSHIELK